MTRVKKIIIYTCNIPHEYLLLSWNEIPKDIQEIIDKQHGLACDGGGYAGSWCKGCHFYGGSESKDFEIDENGEELW